MNSVSSFLTHHWPSSLKPAQPSPSSRPPSSDAPQSAPPAQSFAPPSLPQIQVPPGKVVPLVPWPVMEEYALPYFSEDVLALKPDYKQHSAQKGENPPCVPAWLLAWYKTIMAAAWTALEQDDEKDGAALREYEAYGALVDAFPTVFDAVVTQKVKVERDELRKRIWERWEKLLGLHHLMKSVELPALPSAATASLAPFRSPPPRSEDRVLPFAFNFFPHEMVFDLRLITFDPRDAPKIALYTFPDPSSCFSTKDALPIDTPTSPSAHSSRSRRSSRSSRSSDSFQPSSLGDSPRSTSTAPTSPATSVTSHRRHKGTPPVFGLPMSSTTIDAPPVGYDYSGSAGALGAPFSFSEKIGIKDGVSGSGHDGHERQGRRKGWKVEDEE